jgi:hypothetical protein
VCVFITAVPITKLFAGCGGGTVEDMCYERRRAEACVEVCPSRTSECGGEGYCVKEGGGREGEREVCVCVCVCEGACKGGAQSLL